MQPHPDFVGHTFPRAADLGLCHLTPLTAAQTDEDFEVVMASAPVLGEVFGSWPEGLTREDDHVDLAWHDREFTTGRSFSWIIRDAAGRYLGCLYLFPAIGARGQADGVAWLRDMADRKTQASDLFPVLVTWIEEHTPKSVRIDWTFSPAPA